MRLFEKIEEYYIHRCLELARLGMHSASPNPMVGAIVLDAKGKKVGEGYHVRSGGPHAEIMALEQAGEDAQGGTLYVNLEPCSHTGKTPPCTDAIVKAGIERVVCGTLDPNPLVSGSGRDALQNKRISVRYGFLEQDCLRLNETFFHYISTKTPYVSLKLGLTMDGKIAARNGQSQWLTGPLSRQFVHHLRSYHDAILTTAETVLVDDPELTVRELPVIARQPVRVVLDRQCRLDPMKHKIFDTSEAQTWVFTSKIHQDRRYLAQLEDRGIQVFEADDTGTGLNMKEVFDTLGQQSISNVFVEAGGHLAGHLMNANLIHKLYLFYAPRILPDPMAIGAFSDSVNLKLPDTPDIEIAQSYRLEKDLVVEAYPKRKPIVISGSGAHARTVLSAV
ncbi:MAG: bifunctional diaminohydroxyphosphoribosylaminopyrimidine deaminase/5-amino-6-(5-phosphoribosylamino)uracil reductase RibD [Vampirovibrionales bacterium]|nr:bifunctional diaminohydroxyphosphoribosylaminopyrimidine deaminase/5-amino-6-(5-phosphoribosylamino)uracil reductase RibD [Vampirovibrionales bacterium]